MGVAKVAADKARGGLAVSLVGYALNLPANVLEDDRSGEATFARHLAMYLTHVAFGMSLGRVAIVFGRDRSTVKHACGAIEDRRDDPRFDRWLSALERSAAAAPVPFGEAA